MSKSKRKTRIVYQPPSPFLWKGRDSLELVYQLNERALTLLVEAARSGTSEWLSETAYRALWSELTTEALQTAARIPFVILDARFTDDEWWREAAVSPQEFPLTVSGAPGWPGDVAQQLMSETLVFAWHTAKWDRRLARGLLGMSPGVVGSIARLTPRELGLIPSRHWAALRLRWEDEPGIWARLLTAAQESDEEALAECHLHAQLLLSRIARSSRLKCVT